VTFSTPCQRPPHPYSSSDVALFFPLNTLKPFSYNTIIVRGFGMTSEITLVLLILAVTIILFVTELFPVDVIVIIGMLTFG
jgi:hypothetical protein